MDLFVSIILSSMMRFSLCSVYKDESASLRSLLTKTAEKIDEDYWLNSG